MILKIIKISFVSLCAVCFFFLLSDYIYFVTQAYRPTLDCHGDCSNRLETNIEFDKNKKSVVLVGCSFTYGSGIKINETLAYKLQEQTKRKTYNKGVSARGPQFILRDIQISDFFNKKEIIEPEYVIYTFISDHMRRLYVDYFCLSRDCHTVMDLYKIKNNDLIFKAQNVSPEDYFQITGLVKQYNMFLYNLTSDDEKFDRLKLYLLAIKKELVSRYPDIKFAVLVYNPNLDIKNNKIKPYRTERWKELEAEGITVLRFDTPEYDFLKESEYISPFDKIHPNGRAWDILAPVIIEKLGM